MNYIYKNNNAGSCFQVAENALPEDNTLAKFTEFAQESDTLPPDSSITLSEFCDLFRPQKPSGRVPESVHCHTRFQSNYFSEANNNSDLSFFKMSQEEYEDEFGCPFIDNIHEQRVSLLTYLANDRLKNSTADDFKQISVAMKGASKKKPRCDDSDSRCDDFNSDDPSRGTEIFKYNTRSEKRKRDEEDRD